MERGSDKHSPLVDDQLKHETEGMLRSGHGTHAEEWKDPEPSGEDQPQVDASANGSLVGGTPDGLDADDVNRRAELATYLSKEMWPATTAQLFAAAEERSAPDWVMARLSGLPDATYETLGEVWSAAGGGHEEHRF